MPHIDLTNCTFEQFVVFIFDHEYSPMNVPEWYWEPELEVQYNPTRHANCYIQLFTEPAFLLDRFPRLQLDQAFWAIAGYMPGPVQEIMWDTSIPFELREKCVRSMYFLFEKLYAVNSLTETIFMPGSSCEMWWDLLAGDYSTGSRNRASSDEDRRMQDVMFDTLCQILDLGSEECQGAALHGLNHLRHPETDKAIHKWIRAHPELSAGDIEHAGSHASEVKTLKQRAALSHNFNFVGH